MKVACTNCGAAVDLDDRSAGRTLRCAECGKSFVAPRQLAVTGQRHTLTPFSIATLMLLHFVTAGLFTSVYLSLLHERMPRLRRDDPSATVALGLCFVPVFHLYWCMFNFHRLCLRVNEQRRFAGLEESAPQWLAIPVGGLLACAMGAAFFSMAGIYALGMIGLVAMPFFACLVQMSINELCEHEAAQGTGVPATA